VRPRSLLRLLTLPRRPLGIHMKSATELSSRQHSEQEALALFAMAHRGEFATASQPRKAIRSLLWGLARLGSRRSELNRRPGRAVAQLRKEASRTLSEGWCGRMESNLYDVNPTGL
jgi:hypothetical protein